MLTSSRTVHVPAWNGQLNPLGQQVLRPSPNQVSIGKLKITAKARKLKVGQAVMPQKTFLCLICRLAFFLRALSNWQVSKLMETPKRRHENKAGGSNEGQYTKQGTNINGRTKQMMSNLYCVSGQWFSIDASLMAGNCLSAMQPKGNSLEFKDLYSVKKLTNIFKVLIHFLVNKIL